MRTLNRKCRRKAMNLTLVAFTVYAVCWTIACWKWQQFFFSLFFCTISEAWISLNLPWKNLFNNFLNMSSIFCSTVFKYCVKIWYNKTYVLCSLYTAMWKVWCILKWKLDKYKFLQVFNSMFGHQIMSFKMTKYFLFLNGKIGKKFKIPWKLFLLH